MNMGEKALRNCFSCFFAAAASSLASVVPQWETCVRNCTARIMGDI
jgi:hypothetical protein